MNNLMEDFDKDPLVVLQIHGMKWLSKAHVMKQMGLCNHDLWGVHQLAKIPTNFGNEQQYSLIVHQCVWEVLQANLNK